MGTIVCEHCCSAPKGGGRLTFPPSIQKVNTMRRYLTEANPEYASMRVDPMDFLSRTIFESERITRRTGLLDRNGDPILVEEKMDQIGFIRKEGWGGLG